MKTQAELTELLDFIGEYATYLLGSGVHKIGRAHV